MKRITKIDAAAKETKKLRVAAYARVSTDSADQLVSLDAQKEHYEQVIKNCPNWEFAGLYYDEGVSGTKMAKRDGLLRMLADCERGLIDYILVKSISRFSRNTVESVETVRRLSAMGIYIFFEKENIDTGKMEGEMMLSIMSSLAEDESRSLSENNKWSIQKRFQNGTYVIGTPAYGYKNVDGKMVIDEEKAAIVRRMFASVMEGKSGAKIASELQAEGIPTARGGKWQSSVIIGMIRNETYIGVAVFQKTYKDDQFNSRVNYGERGMYSSKYALSGNVVCGHCGNIYRRVVWSVGNEKPVVWRCVSRLTTGQECSARTVPEEDLHAAIASAVNMAYGNRDDIIPVLKENIESVVGCDADEEIEVIDNMIRKSQMDLLDAGRDEARVQEIGERIVSLRERRQNVLTQAALRKDEIDRIKAMITFIEEQTGEAEYSEILVRRMIEKVTIHDDRITVEFKSGLAIDVDA